jgi:hypothetical protein
MNFFEAQERARKSSRLLVLWFALAVIGVILVIYVCATIALQMSSPDQHSIYVATEVSQLGLWNPELLLWTTVLVLEV